MSVLFVQVDSYLEPIRLVTTSRTTKGIRLIVFLLLFDPLWYKGTDPNVTLWMLADVNFTRTIPHGTF